MYFTDLKPCTYNLPEPEGVSVGWLDKRHRFHRGSVPTGFVERLVALCEKPAVQHRGFHVCEFCEFEPDPAYKLHQAAGALSSAVIRVIGRDGRVYYSPTMICHYVAKHGYKPPEDFINAVMETESNIPSGKTLEPSTAGPVGFASRLAVFCRRWLNFLR